MVTMKEISIINTQKFMIKASKHARTKNHLREEGRNRIYKTVRKNNEQNGNSNFLPINNYLD